MAAEDEGKTEEPSQKKIDEAREEGNVAKSQDLSAATVLLFGVLLLWFFGGHIFDRLCGAMVRFFENELPLSLPPDAKGIMPLWMTMLDYTLAALAPFVVALLAVAVLVNVYEVGLRITFKPLEPKFDKLNPVSGVKQLFSMKKIVMLLLNLGKIAVVVAVAYPVISSNFGSSVVLAQMGLPASFTYIADEVWGLALRMALVLFVLAIVDLIYQKHKLHDSLKMTKDEVKDEHRNMEGDPKVKQKIAEKRMELARKRMMQEIPDAEVVVRNPTHYAVALKFKPDMPAPVVVAKGQNKIALTIIERAKEAGVPTWQEPWLARELYKNCEIGDRIPPELFKAVADILAHVMDKEKRAQFRNSVKGGAA